LLKEKLRQQKIVLNHMNNIKPESGLALTTNKSAASVTLNSSIYEDIYKQQNITNNNR
jgi:hypothetical protein